MRIIVSDTSCVIDLRKGGLLEAVFGLPYQFVMPRMMFDDELLTLSPKEKSRLLARGLALEDFDGAGVLQAQRYLNAHPALKLYDCFALVLAEATGDAILLTGDAPLRSVASQKGVEVHGVLWAIDELGAQASVPAQAIHDALSTYLSDQLVFLPESEIRQRLKRIRKKL